ncbi:SAM-dependent methyltransferase [Amycolatopsis pigmentata]|uniref:SAM-dependent methyltransferase n=1 Tax=Amycolatopsis pigmentata TaxID=450801 RepID=A0ABW5G0R6_9PSEU
MSEDLGRARETLASSLDRPSTGRVYDFYLGGDHNYAIDRDFGQRMVDLMPEARIFARENRGFVRRAVRYARTEHGITQFVDIGSGLPTQGNVHEIADESGRDARVVYVDNDPVARAHAQILLSDTADPQRHFAIDADFLDGAELWERVIELGGLDPDQPICLLVSALLHFIVPEQRPEEMLALYRDLLPPGSLLVLSHCTDEDTTPALQEVAARYMVTTSNAHLRGRSEVRAFFGDFELVEPGVVWTPQWRPELAAAHEPPFDGDPASTLAIAGVGRKR